jgi:hypothetical protein
MSSTIEKSQEMIGGSFINQITLFFIILGVFLLIDLPMILIINKKIYTDQFSKIGQAKVGIKLIVSAIICYILMALSLQNFAINEHSFIKASLLGFFIFGVYNTTNLATIENYEVKTALIDTAWGTTLYTLVYLIVVYISSHFIIISDDNLTATTTEIK